ncbi:hypothetical protein Bhyg_13245, partial [Pseudolycoriella hygida]
MFNEKMAYVLSRPVRTNRLTDGRNVLQELDHDFSDTLTKNQSDSHGGNITPKCSIENESKTAVDEAVNDNDAVIA